MKPHPHPATAAGSLTEACNPLLSELVGHLSENRLTLRNEWVRRVIHAGLLSTLGQGEIGIIADSMFTGYVAALAQGGLAGLREFLGRLPEHLRPLGVDDRAAPGLASLLRDVFGRSLFRQFRHYEGRRAESSQETGFRQPRWPLSAPALQPN